VRQADPVPNQTSARLSASAELTRRSGGAPRRLTRGPWSLEVRGDEVSDICFDGVFLLRAIRPVVRDQDWNTVPVRVVAQALTDGPNVALTTHLRFEDAGIAYAATLELRLAEQELVVGFDGEASGDFATNRIGLVVLHPAADAGSEVEVRHTDGSIGNGSWPIPISPHQPFTDVRGFGWAKDGVQVELALTGDTFETEDQRNWTDASFKTYSTPLSRPFPFRVTAGDVCRQEARLTVTGRTTTAASPPQVGADEVTVESTLIGSVPPISVAACLYPLPATPWRGPAAFESVLLELTGDSEHWATQLHSAADQAQAVGAPLDVRIVTDDPAVVENAVGLLAGLGVLRLGVFDTGTHVSTAALWQALQAAARQHRYAGELVGGTRANFTELNRQIEAIPPDAPVLSFSLTPQMHATEIPHLVDNLAMQRLVVANALRLADSRPVLVGPITLARRFNAVATGGAADPADAAGRAVDSLQPSDFVGAWTVGSLAQLSAVPVAGLCYYEITGPRGIVTDSGELTPAGRVLVRIAAVRGCPVLKTVGPADLAALAVRTPESGTELTIGNLSARRRTVTVAGPDGRHTTLDLASWSTESLVL
jgi:hypothetical protein